MTSEADLIAEEVEKLLADMTLEEKIYQMFIVTPEQLTGVSTVTAAGDATKATAEKGKMMNDAIVEHVVKVLNELDEKDWKYRR